jgi:F-type H+-transporting ATPase subunit epsilon
VAQLNVELVSPEREVWSGEATMVLARTLDGELGILPNHAPLLGQLVEGGVVIIRRPEDQEDVSAAVHGGFFSVSENRVSILSEIAELAHEIDVDRARSALDRATEAGADDQAAAAAAERARARLRAAGHEEF